MLVVVILNSAQSNFQKLRQIRKGAHPLSFGSTGEFIPQTPFVVSFSKRYFLKG